MITDSRPCVDCGRQFTLSEKEKQKFDDLVAEQGYKYPKRCRDCRKLRRSNSSNGGNTTEATALPRRIVLATTDFENLVTGRVVKWRDVEVILADIGFEAMKNAIMEAEKTGRHPLS